jgi:hypothetical protein
MGRSGSRSRVEHRREGRGYDPIRLVGVLVASVMGLLVLLAGGSPSSAAAACANEDRREEQGAFGSSLPECRAYELVTPPIKGSGEPASVNTGEPTPAAELEPLQVREDCCDEVRTYGSVHSAYAAVDGNRISWYSDPVPLSEAPGTDFLSTRTENGWASEDVIPPLGPQNALLCPPSFLGVQGPAWSADLTKVVFELPAGLPVGFQYENECGHDEPRLVPGEPERLHNLFLHDTVTGSNQLINVTPEDEPWFEWPEPTFSNQPPPWPYFLAASSDLSHIVFEEEIKLTQDAPVGFPAASAPGQSDGGELYEWTDGEVRLVTYLPDGTPVPGQLASATRGMFRGSQWEIFNEPENIARYRHAVSVDGSRIFWEDGTEPREEPNSRNKGDLYLREGGVKTTRIDAAQPGATGPSGGGDFWYASGDGSRAFFTSDNQLTVDSTAEPARPDLYEWRSQGTDGCTANDGCVADLTVNPGEAANVLGVSAAPEDGDDVDVVAGGALGDQPNPEGETPTAGEPNLYLAHAGSIEFVAGLDREGDFGAWDYHQPTAKASSDGLHFAFNTTRPLTGYDNTDANNGDPDYEIYLYDAAAGSLDCASCLPDGSRPVGGAALRLPQGTHSGFWVNGYPQRSVSDRGQVFFETTDALVERDTNGRRDVYQYLDGVVSLLSSGTGEEGTHFVDATPSGNDVFITTAQRLVRRDSDTVYDYYDVRVGGGFPEAPPAPGCEVEGCRGPASAALPAPSPSTSQFEGPGNRKQLNCARGMRKRHGKCVRRHRRHRHYHKQAHKRAAGFDREVGR